MPGPFKCTRDDSQGHLTDKQGTSTILKVLKTLESMLDPKCELKSPFRQYLLQMARHKENRSQINSKQGRHLKEEGGGGAMSG